MLSSPDLSWKDNLLFVDMFFLEHPAETVCGSGYRTMMGEYIIYYRGKIVGGIYDDRFLVKPTKSAVAMMPDADTELPTVKKKK